MFKLKRNLIIITAFALLFGTTAQAQDAKEKAEAVPVNFAYQNGWAYTPLRVMQTQELVQKHAKKIGVDLNVSFKNLGSPGVIRDSMIAGHIQFAAVGVPTLISLADKTELEWKAVGNIVSLPMLVNTNEPEETTKTVCDIKGKIALPTIKVSVQAVTLQMAAKKLCGGPLVLDSKTVSMTHPDGYTALLSGQIAAHFTAPPFSSLEVEKGEGKIRTLINSYDILGGKTSFILLVGSDKWRKEHPKAYQAVSEAFEEAIAWTRNNPQKAAELYVKEEKSKESVEDVTKQMTDGKTLFDTTPDRISTYSDFMHEIGSVKRKMTWQDLSMPNLHNRKGS